MHGLHSFVHNLPVSPLALPPPALRIEGGATLDDCAQLVTDKRPPVCYMHDTERSRDAGSTVTTRLRGPKNGVHLTGRSRTRSTIATTLSDSAAVPTRRKRVDNDPRIQPGMRLGAKTIG